MSPKSISGGAYVLLLWSSLVFSAGILPIKAFETIYIKADGSIDPSTAPIERYGSTYVLEANVTCPIVVERNDVVINGNAHVLHNSAYYGSRGLDLTGRTNVSVRNMKIEGFDCGVWLDSCVGSVVTRTNITTSGRYGIYLRNSDDNDVTENSITMTASGSGVYLDSSCSNRISGNCITSGGYGVYLYLCSYGNSVSGNSIAGNSSGVFIEWYSDGNYIYSNSIACSGHCVFVCFSDNNRISQNNMTGSSWYCIFVDSSDHNIIDENNVATTGDAVYLDYNSDRNSISANNLTTSGGDGVYLDSGSNNNGVDGNHIVTSGGHGIHVGFSHHNRASGNNIIASIGGGILLDSSFNSSLVGNKVTNSACGIHLNGSSSALIYHNNLVNNAIQACFSSRATCTWDNGYSGNYWSDYNGTDSDQDGIGDTPYSINGNNTDSRPLMNPYWPADINYDLKVDTLDVAKIVAAYGTKPLDPYWNPCADIVVPFKLIDILDLVICTSHYGQKWP